MTSMEREEKEKVKKREKKLEDEETLQQATWVKYTFPIKHQVYHTFICSFCNFVIPWAVTLIHKALYKCLLGNLYLLSLSATILCSSVLCSPLIYSPSTFCNV